MIAGPITVCVENACIQFWRIFDPPVLTRDIDTTKKPLERGAEKMSRSEARPWSHPQRTIWWTDDKLNPEEHYTIQPGNLNHIRSVPGF